MTTNNYQHTDIDDAISVPPDLSIFTILRLGLFNLGVGLMAVLTLAVLNRVMITELAIPASIAAGTLALSQLVAPIRVWLGQLSDGKKLFGFHRTGYIRTGIVMAGVTILIAVQLVWILGTNIEVNNGWQWNPVTIGTSVGLGIMFILHGIALGASSTPFTALLVDISEEESRSKIVATIWSMLMVGIVIGGITGNVFLGSLAVGEMEENPLISVADLQTPINMLFLLVAGVVVILAFVGTWNIEKKYSRFHLRASNEAREQNIGLRQALRVLTSSRQTAIFFFFLMMVTTSLFMQESVLEPYGGDVFGMGIGETTLLNSFWGVGILLGYSATGFLVIPRIGKKNATRIGCLLVAICFVLIIFAGLTQNESILKGTMVLFGIAAGITTIGSLSLMLDLTVAETAGTFVGAWGLSQAMARGIAIALGGWVLDIGKFIFGSNLWLAYSSVFFCEALVALGAILLLNKVNIKEFKESTRKATELVMEGDLD
ncbi:BCD family MFS transporter [Cyanobacterium sp. IPPAS B-1200]|uniref:BCD family MFS transporter n=1 Tax=Cyanobacterium sp. IPPAS B-1200 TaxID=1562720 RepID=UPI00085266BA|nr:BCD family MFS transporter [Cyanobacterium sp. IPPAS B-1200]OEJ77672.1 MFS transporter [Cyanobacterium sp. IPPAS B-1200]